MGRWGHCLFEADNDVDNAIDLAFEITGTDEGPEFEALTSLGHSPLPGHHRDINAPTSDAGRLVLERLRQKLDAGLGSELLKKYRGLEHTPDNEWEKHEARYTVIILGALLMSTGARISDDDLQHLRQLTSTVQCNETFTLAFADTGFRGPGKKQFLASLDNYQPGTPRGFNEPSCHGCGKTRQDTATALLRCGRCTVGPAWFCDKDCQRSVWRTHKPNCGERERGAFVMLNV